MPSRNIKEWLAAFREEYLEQGGSQETWEGDYLKVLQHLPQYQPLTAKRLANFVKKWEPNTRSRVRACTAANALAKFAGVDFHAGKLKGRYKAKPVDVTRIPDDTQISSWFKELDNHAWRWVYSAIACYGLRPHEALRATPASISPDGTFTVAPNTKTGQRVVFPIYPEWFHTFAVGHPHLPPINYTRPNQALGHAASEYFHDTAKLPWNLYAMRHAWARRAYLSGLDDTAAALMMGHSLTTHREHYQAWFNTMELARAYQRMMANPNRPLPPS
jgi:hypothetical protein